MAGDEEDVNVDVTLSDYLSAPADNAADNVEELAREIKGLNRQLLLLDKRATKAALSIAQLDAATAAYVGRNKEMSQQFEGLNKQVSTYTGELRKTGKALDRTTGKTKKARQEQKKFHDVLKNSFKLFKRMPGVIFAMGKALGILGLVGAAGPAVQGIIQVSGALVALAGYLLILPTAIGAAVVGVAALVVGFQGMGDAIGAAMSGDVGKFNEAIKELSPAAQKFAKSIRKWAPEFKKIKKAVQEALFIPLSKEIEPTLGALLKTFSVGLKKVGGDWGDFFAEVMRGLRTVKAQKVFDTLFSNASSFIQVLKKSFKPLANGLGSVILAASPHWDRFMNTVLRWATTFGNWLDRISKDGSLDKWLNTASIVASQLGDALQLVGEVILDISRASGGLSASPLVNILTALHDFTSSAEGQQAIVSLFDALRRVMVALKPLLFTVAGAIGKVLAPAIADIVEGIGPGLNEFLQAIVAGLVELAPLWGPLGRAVGDFLVALIPLIPFLSTILQFLGLELPIVLQLLGTILKPLLQVGLAPFMAVFKALASLLQAAGPFIAEILTAIAEALEPLGPIMGEIVTMFGKEFAKFLEKLVPVLREMTPLIVDFITAFGAELMSAIRQLLPMLPALFHSFFMLASVITDPRFVSSLLQLAMLFVALSPTLLKMTPVIVQLAAIVLTLVTYFIMGVAAVMHFGLTVANIIGRMAGIITGDLKPIFDILVGPFKAAATFITNLILGLVKKVSDLLKSIKGPNIQGQIQMKSTDANPFGRAMGGDVMAGKKYTVGEIGKELYLPDHGGRAQVIGAQGQEERTFPSSGFVVPNYVVQAMESAEKSMERQVAKMNNASMAREDMRELIGATRGSGGTHEENHYEVNVNVNGGSDLSPADIEKAVRKAISKIERDKRERR